MARHTPRHARCLVAAGRVFGEPLRAQRGEKPKTERRNRAYIPSFGVTRAGVDRNSMPA